MKLIKAFGLLLVAAGAFAAGFVYLGIFDVSADVPHWPLVHRLMEVTRARSIAVRSNGIQVPPLDDPKLIADGAEHYSAMCTGCHLAPGMTDSEIRPGLYPQPPDLTKPLDASATEMFWVMKHGIKMSAMPAWGKTHDDQAIWGMVAFVRKLPSLSPEEYQALTGGPSGGEAHHHHHGSGGATEGEQEHGGGEAGMPAEHEHAHGDDHAHEQASTNTTESGPSSAADAPTIPESADGIWLAIGQKSAELKATIKDGSLEQVHHQAFAIRDLVAALPKRSPALSPDEKTKLQNEVKFVASLADRLDATGDANDRPGAQVNFDKLVVVLNGITRTK